MSWAGLILAGMLQVSGAGDAVAPPKAPAPANDPIIRVREEVISGNQKIVREYEGPASLNPYPARPIEALLKKGPAGQKAPVARTWQEYEGGTGLSLKNGVLDIGGGGGGNVIREYDGPASQNPFGPRPQDPAAKPKPGPDPVVHVREEKQGGGGGGIKINLFNYWGGAESKTSSAKTGPASYNTYTSQTKPPTTKKTPLPPGKDAIRVREEDEAGGGGDLKFGIIDIAGGGGGVHIRDFEGKASANPYKPKKKTDASRGHKQVSFDQPAEKAPAAGAATVQKRSISQEAALSIARLGLKAGIDRGVDVAVAVVDQSGTLLVLLRADNGTPQFVEGASQKAWTSVNFRASTRDLFEDIKKGKEDFSQLPFVPKALFLMGGVPLKDGNAVVGAVGVAGAVSGAEDDAIARHMSEAFAQLRKK